MSHLTLLHRTSTPIPAKSRQAIPLESPEPAPSTLKPEPGEIIDQPVKTTGMDGKQYSSAHHTAPAP